MSRPKMVNTNNYPVNFLQNNFQSPPPGMFHSQSIWEQRNTFQNVNTSLQYWCETCDRGFNTQSILDNHKRQHEKCNIDGCQFVAHSKVITRHIQMQHSTGLYSKIAKLQNPEEINKWREERKKRYPTKVNIEKKNAEITEKINRGEKMGLYKSHFKTSRDKGPKPYTGSKHINKTKRKCNTNMTQPKINKTRPPHYKSTDLHLQNKEEMPLKPFKGIQYLLQDYDENIYQETENVDFDIDDDVDDVCLEDTEKPEGNINIVCGALSMLIGNYESSGEEVDHSKSTANPALLKNIISLENTSIISSKVKFNVDVCKTDIKDENAASSDSGPEEEKIVKEINATNLNSSENSFKSKAHKTIPPNTFKKHISKVLPKRYVPSTLLQKLLCKEIIQERNIVLQCIRHIINSKYFNDNEK